MAKKVTTGKKTGFSLQGFDLAHYARTEDYVSAIERIYNQAIAEFASMALRANVDPDKPFSFANYPSTKAAAAKITTGLTTKMKAIIAEGSREQWLYAGKKNDAFLASIMDTSKVNKKLLAKYQDNNLLALKQFQERKVNGMGLSERIWKQGDQFKKTMEYGIDVGLGEGRSAQTLSKDLRQNLLDPDRLFRRVRDKRGVLQLSKAAQDFHPGQGVYRSSYKNAMRLTRSEINMAYRDSDQSRHAKLDFVVGYEVRLSNNHTLNGKPFTDICDSLVGKYPKTFIFKGWHPQCKCFKTPILQDPDEFDTDELNELKAAINGTEYKKLVSKNTVAEVPENFKNWMGQNQAKVDGYKSTPYFIKDNFKNGKIADGLMFDKPLPKIATPAPVIVPPEVKIVPPADPVISPNFPAALGKEGNYMKGEDYTFDQKFFNMIDPAKPIRLEFTSRENGVCFIPGKRVVNLCDGARIKASAWEKKAVVYHEYGHGLDWQKGLRMSPEVQTMRLEQIKALKKQSVKTIWTKGYDYEAGKYANRKITGRMSEVAYIDHKLQDLATKLWRMDKGVFERRGISKMDAIEQIGSTRDTIKSLVNSYGGGHSNAYFRRFGMSEAEYLAHAFENAFLGNKVFEKYMPDIYREMVAYIRQLK